MQKSSAFRAPSCALTFGLLLDSQPPPPRRPQARRKGVGKMLEFVLSFVIGLVIGAFYGWEPVLWFGVYVAAFFGALVCLSLYAAGKG